MSELAVKETPVKYSAGAGLSAGTSRRDSNGRVIGVAGLTPNQRAYVIAIVKNGGNSHAAAIEAGYSDGRTGWQLEQLPHVRSAIHAEREKKLGRLASMALGTIEAILDPESEVSPRDKLKAATWVLESVGHGKQGAKDEREKDGKELAEMSIEELEAEYLRNKAREVEIRARVVKESIDVSSSEIRDSSPPMEGEVESEQGGDASTE